MKRYDPKSIEPKWQQQWDADGTYTADLDSTKPKYIAMSMFNYPSGAGIHIGHAMNYTISDVLARFKRQQGFESYHPVGWDSFGLPAENYAIKAGVSPQESMKEIIPNYHKQYKAMGWSNDWTKEITTSNPDYYKWTQWIFSEMYRAGLAYQDARMQWWCTKCQTVLANEQVIDGKCWRHDGPDDPLVEKKEVKQWFFRITDYADDLLDAVDDLDWTESVKLAQKNWIGRSSGAEITFEVADSEQALTVFTTRPDTLFGATFMVVAPEHDIVRTITTDEQKADVEAYVKEAAKKTELERQTSKEKTGVFTGAYAINPANQEKVPIWIADYVLLGYGTGAIMAVPAHDERDNEFAKKYDLPIVSVIETDEAGDGIVTEGTMVNSGSYDGLDSAVAREKIVADLEKQGVAKSVTNYRMRDWSVSRQRYWGAPIPIINCPKDGHVLVPDDQLPVVLPELDDFQPSGDGRSALARATDWLHVACPKCGGPAERETDTLDTYICSSWYMLRYFDPHNEQQAFSTERVNHWMPIDFYNGADHATAHMLYARFVTRFFHKQGLINNPEPFKRFLFNGKVTAHDGQMFSKSKGNGIDPLEIINSGYGADALRMYLMFAAPLELWARWDPQGVPGTHRFLSRLWTLTQEYLEAAEEDTNEAVAKQLRVITTKMTVKVTEDVEATRYNTAVSALMTAVNELYKLKVTDLAKNSDWRAALEAVVMCVAPLAPFIAEELWHELGNTDTVHRDHWPQIDQQYLTNDTVTVVVQINGKVRAQLDVAVDSDQETVEAAARSDAKVAGHLDGQTIKKVIYVPNKILNIVV